MVSAVRDRPVYRYARFLFLKTLTIATGAVDTPNNGRFRVPRNFNPDDYWSLRRGRYEKEEVRILDAEFQDDDLIIEIGSNIGYMARRACGKLKPGGKLVCIEANPNTLPFLKANLSDASKSHDIEIIAAAIGAPEREGERQSFQQRVDLGSSLGEVTVPKDGATEIQVEVRTLSSVVNNFDPEGRGYSLICDAEGAEILILTKDAESLSRCRQIAIELHEPSLTGSETTPDDMVRMLEELGFVHELAVADAHFFRRA